MTFLIRRELRDECSKRNGDKKNISYYIYHYYRCYYRLPEYVDEKHPRLLSMPHVATVG